MRTHDTTRNGGCGPDDEHRRFLDTVQRVMVDSLRQTSLGAMADALAPVVGGGKMLRARLAAHLAPACGVPHPTLINAAAAVELAHAASLLHDDVIDNAALRRGNPAFWREKGVSGAILLGDLLVCTAIRCITQEAGGRFVPVFVEKVTEMCDAEALQELVLRNQPPSWEQCVATARHKTGALFAIVGHVCGGAPAARTAALTESAYLLGTAFQLADDMLDAFGDPAAADKSLGADAQRAKITAGNSYTDMDDPIATIDALCDRAVAGLADWPELQQAFTCYLQHELRPVIARFVAAFAERVAAHATP